MFKILNGPLKDVDGETKKKRLKRIKHLTFKINLNYKYVYLVRQGGVVH